MSTKLRNLVRCDCKKCNGKYVKDRTRGRHIEKEHFLASTVSGFVPSLPGNNRHKPAHTVLEVQLQKNHQDQKKRLNKKNQLHLTIIMNLILPFLFLKKGKGKISFENRKSISMKIQVMMKVINRLTIMNMKVTYLQKVMIWF